MNPKVIINDHVLERDFRFPSLNKKDLKKFIENEVQKSRLIEFQPDGRERRLYGKRVYITKYSPEMNTQTVITVLVTRSTLNHSPEREVLIHGYTETGSHRRGRCG